MPLSNEIPSKRAYQKLSIKNKVSKPILYGQQRKKKMLADFLVAENKSRTNNLQSKVP
jgi:hypothetical protein